ncbi:Uncharacterised protein [uncultured archaeon]|nr:Uncharacterised protein [uncultured archaeon]
MGLAQTVTAETKNYAAAAGTGTGLFALHETARKISSLPSLKTQGLENIAYTVSKFLTETGPNPDLTLYTVLALSALGGHVKGARGYIAAATATSLPYIVNRIDSIPFVNDQANSSHGDYSTGTILGYVITGFLVGTTAKWIKDKTVGKSK